MLQKNIFNLIEIKVLYKRKNML